MARYWVGGTNTWNATAGTKWSATDGGPGGASVPTATDDVFFTNNSTGTCTVGAGSVCKNLDFTGFGGTLAGAGSLAISGSLTLAAGMGRTYTGAITFNAASGTNTIKSNTLTLASAITIDDGGGGATFQLTDAFVTTVNFTVTRAALFDTNTKNLTVGRFLSNNGNTRAITMSGSHVKVTLNGTVWDFTNVTGLTFTVDTSTVIEFANATATNATAVMNALTYNDIQFTGSGTGQLAISGTGAIFRDWIISTNSGANFQQSSENSVRNVDFTGFTGAWTGTGQLDLSGDLTMGAGMTRTWTGNLFLLNTSGTQTLTSHGITFASPVRRNAAGGTTQLGDTFSTTGQLKLSKGTFDCNDQQSTFDSFHTSIAPTGVREFRGGNQRCTLTGSTAITTGGDTTNLTFSPETCDFYLTNTGAIVIGGDLTYYNVTVAGGGSGSLTINAGPTMNKLSVLAGPYTVTLQITFTLELAANGLAISGSAGNVVNLQTSNPGGVATIDVDGSDVVCDYVNVRDIKAIGGARYFMGSHSTDGGNNTGLRFTNLYRSPPMVWSGFGA